MNNTGILLESGTGEAEILKFIVAGKKYAINVVKVKEILPLNDLTPLPNAHPAIIGITLIRGDVVTIIDLYRVLEKKSEEGVDLSKKKILLCEFNNMKVAFAVDEVIGIHRVRWDEMHTPDPIIQGSGVIANIQYEGVLFMLLDFESIVVAISPETGINLDMLSGIEEKDRAGFKIALADDSRVIRDLLRDTLQFAGYKNLKFFDDGQAALDYFEALADEKGENFTEDVDLLITDIEMPKLDGHTLVRNLKEHKILNKLPIVIFSSLITYELRHKGESVGADAQLSKPEIKDLVNEIDGLLGLI